MFPLLLLLHACNMLVHFPPSSCCKAQKPSSGPCFFGGRDGGLFPRQRVTLGSTNVSFAIPPDLSSSHEHHITQGTWHARLRATSVPLSRECRRRGGSAFFFFFSHRIYSVSVSRTLIIRCGPFPGNTALENSVAGDN